MKFYVVAPQNIEEEYSNLHKTSKRKT